VTERDLFDMRPDPDELLARTKQNVELSGPNAAALVDWFLAKVAA